MRDKIKKEIVNIIAEVSNLESIIPDVPLIDQGIDSITMMMVFVAIEEHYHFLFDEVDYLEVIDTAVDLCNIVEKRLKGT